MQYLNGSVFALTIVGALLSIGCGSDDETPAPAKFALTSPSIKAGMPIADEFTCDGKAFGDGTSPELAWSNAPSGANSYAILLKDLTIEAGEAGDMNPEHPFHWAIWNIPGSTTKISASLANDQHPLVGGQQQNGGPPGISPGAFGYFGPCPNLAAAGLGADLEVHNDAFILYAFSEPVLTPPAYDPGSDAANPLNPVRQLATFFESHPSKLATAELKFTSDATPDTCEMFPNPPFSCGTAPMN